jgi:lipopolysaccharide biosynthesis regulator YciM
MRFLRKAAIAIAAACAITSPIAAQEASGDAPGTVSFRRGRYNVSGTVRESGSNRQLESVRVELVEFGAGVLASTVTSSNGNFAFSNVRVGSYALEFRAAGYETHREEVNFGSRPPVGIQISLRPSGELDRVPVGDTVSKRELLIPRRAREAMERGLSLMHEKTDYQGSISQFQRALREYPQYYEAYAQMGAAYMSLGDMAKSEEMLSNSIEMSGRAYPDALFILAALYSGQQRYADAEPLAREAAKLNPLSWHANHELARALHGLDQEAEAETSALQALGAEPGNLQTILLLANIHLRMPNYPQLIRDLDTYLELAPDGPDAPQARQMREQVLERMANIQPRSTTPP